MIYKFIRFLGFIIIPFITPLFLFSKGFTISGTQLIDANGKEFIIRGVNNPHIWFTHKSFKALKRLADLNVNSIRIVWETKGKAKELDKIISRCIELQMIPMVELHDVTGNDSVDELLKTVAYYTRDDVKEVLLKHEKYILINFANEWGNFGNTNKYWKKSYMQAIDMLREAGIKTTLVIDVLGWGQKIEPVFEYGKDLLEYDPQKNLLFSVHMYGSWNNPKTIEEQLQKAYDASLPLIVGEFGYNYHDGNNNLKCKVDHTVILKKCQELGYGYLAWSWSGNNTENAWLNLSNDWKTLTWWGKEVFEGEYGIINTAKKASVFLTE